MLAASSEEDRALIDAYTKGVNAGLSALATKPFEYLLLGLDPAPWQPEDCALVMYSMYLDLQGDQFKFEAGLGLMHDLLPGPLFEFLAPRGTEWDAPLEGEAFAMPSAPAADVFDTIFESEAHKWQVNVRPEDMQYLRDLCLHKWHKPLRACYPRDVCQLLTSISQYERRPVRVTPDELERATMLYFTHQKAVEDV